MAFSVIVKNKKIRFRTIILFIIFTGRRIFKPVAIKGCAKYNGKGLYTKESFSKLGLKPGIADMLSKAANHSISSNTWKTYSTVKKHIDNCSKYYNKNFKFPMEQQDIIKFIGWLLAVRKVKGSTVDVYVSALRQIHLASGFVINGLRPDIVNSIISGQKNMDSMATQTRTRLPVTFSVLKLLKIELNKLDISKCDKRLVWAVCSLNFFGALRVHESLARNKSYFDPTNTLMGKDLVIKRVNIQKESVCVIQIRIKSPKESRAVTDKIIDIYENKGPLCPARALRLNIMDILIQKR